ncbi:hypothetical protein RRG08_066494 [Elysia crispata]|uniref:Uncharacterized protein n=1 Tax=Elysia crispata TaxID=231223 RepID=A0AAE0ZEM8_9GAST|nr:hypothetical protein RRG08_066494 [Elysia crispata]
MSSAASQHGVDQSRSWRTFRNFKSGENPWASFGQLDYPTYLKMVAVSAAYMMEMGEFRDVIHASSGPFLQEHRDENKRRRAMLVSPADPTFHAHVCPN